MMPEDESPAPVTPDVPDAPALPVAPVVPQPNVASSTEAAVISQIAAQVEGDPIPFVVKLWHDHPNYCCKFCPWAYLDDELEAWLHYDKTHIILDERQMWRQISRMTPFDQVAAYVPPAEG